MFNNIGGKIKGLATAMTIIGFVIFGIIGLMFILGSLAYGDEEAFVGMIGGVLTIVIGCFISWIGSFLMYGFGELIENSEIIAINTMDDGKSKMTAAVNNNQYQNAGVNMNTNAYMNPSMNPNMNSNMNSNMNPNMNNGMNPNAMYTNQPLMEYSVPLENLPEFNNTQYPNQ